MISNRLPHLLSPGRIGSLDLKNRIAVTSMGVSLSEDDGTVGERLIAYHEEQAKGGAALIVMGVMGVAWPVASVCWRQTAISDDSFIPGLKTLCERIHATGGKIAAQLHHGGQNGYFANSVWGHPMLVPSLPEKDDGDFAGFLLPEELANMGDGAPAPTFKVLEKADIKLVVEQFRQAARRAIVAGFDGIEIHAGHGYLLSSFISPKSNKRTDEYGGSLENRMRLPLEVLAAVRAEVGQVFPVWVKLDSREVGVEGGIRLEDSVAAAKMLEETGANAITVTAYHNNAVPKLHSGSHTPQGEASNLPFAARIRGNLSIPVIASGRVEPEVGDRAIGNGEVDFIAMGRKLLADPFLPKKLTSGQAEKVRPCIYCYTCVSAIYVGQPVRCAVNPELAHESERRPATLAPSHFAVVGGGPGGMEAARRLRSAGHRVTLVERSERLGGTLRFAGLAYEPNERLLRWLINAIDEADIEVLLNTDATPELLRSLGVQDVIVATGAVRGMPEIRGNDYDHVFSGDDMRKMMFGETSQALKRKTSLFTRLATKVGAVTGASANLGLVRKATRTWMPLGRRVVIVGGELVGLELAEFLHERGRHVSIIEEGPRMGRGLTLLRRMRILQELADHGVGLHSGVTDIRINKETVEFTGETGDSHSLPADTVIVAKGATGDTQLAQRLADAGFRVSAVGDANGVGYIEGAVRGAYDAVTRLVTPEAA